MRKKISFTLAAMMLLGISPITACNQDNTSGKKGENVLRIASWDEYIDMGGDFLDPSPDGDADYIAWYQENMGIDPLTTDPIYKEFEDWYNDLHPDNPITVEYIALQDNETMYNKIKMGDEYDLLCPSEYMAMKLKAEDRLLAFDEEFFDPTIEGNYYAQNVSEYTTSIFKSQGLYEYIAGYMWGSTGFVYNPEKFGNSIEEAR